MTPEEEYNQQLKRLVDGAKKIENPLLSEEKREQYLKLYDRIEERVMELKKVISQP